MKSWKSGESEEEKEETSEGQRRGEDENSGEPFDDALTEPAWFDGLYSLTPEIY